MTIFEEWRCSEAVALEPREERVGVRRALFSQAEIDRTVNAAFDNEVVPHVT